MERLSNELVSQILQYPIQKWSFPEEIPSDRTEVVKDLNSLARVCSRTLDPLEFEETLTKPEWWREIVTSQIFLTVKQWTAQEFRQHYINAAASGFTLGLITLGRSSQRQQLSEPSLSYAPITTREAALQSAAAEGRNGALRHLIDEGANLETSYLPYGNTPLWIAVHSGHRSTAEILLDAGAAINGDASSEGRTALFGALASASIHTLGRGSSSLDGTGMLSFLLERGANPHVRDSRGRKALHYAAVYGLLDEIDILIQWGALADDRDDDETPLMMACEGHHPLVVRGLLDRGVSVDRRDDQDETALIRLCQRQLYKSDFKSLKILLEHGANVNHFALGCTPLYFALERKDLDLLMFLLRHGADIETVDGASRSALGVFCDELMDDRDEVVMSLLLDSGANPLLAGPGVAPPLHLVATYQPLCFGTRQNLMRLLLEAGASTEALNFQGETVLTAVYGSVDLRMRDRTATGRFLLENGANVNGVSAAKAPIRTPGLSSTLLELLFEFGTDINAQDEQGNTALDLAIRRAEDDSIALLRREGALVGAKLFQEVSIPVG